MVLRLAVILLTLSVSSLYAEEEEFSFDELEISPTDENSQIEFSQKNTYFLKVSYLSWSTLPKLNRKNDSDIDLYSQEKGLCVGGGIELLKDSWGSSFSLCYAMLTGTIGESKDNVITLNQNNIRIDGLYSKNSVFWRPKTDTKIGVGIPLVYREADYGSLALGTIEDEQKFSYGLEMNLEWTKKEYAYTFAIGQMNKYDSSFFELGLHYFLD